MKILIADDVHDYLTNGLKTQGHDVHYLPMISRDEIIKLLPDIEVLVIRTKTQVDKQVLEAGTNLKLIARAGAGLDNIDITFCEKHQIKYVHAGGANANSVGEHAVGMLLSLLHNLAKSDKEVRAGIWDRKGNTGNELNGKTIGIIGYGHTGTAFAKCLSGFGVKVLAYDKYRKHYGDDFADEASLDFIYLSADVISFHVPLTDETRYYFNQEFIHNMKKPFILLNLSRGEIVQTKALVDALEHKKVISAGLDVLENERLESLTKDEQNLFEKLIKRNNLILSPHVGGWSVQSYENISKVLLQKIKELTPLLAHS